METIFNLFLTLHIIGGFISLFSGALVLSIKKGGKWHHKIGWIYSYGMIVTGISSLILSYIRENGFLAVLGIFVLYKIGTGVRLLRLQNQKVSFLDYVISGCMFCILVLFIVMGMYLFTLKDTMGVVPIFIGMFGLLMIRTDYKVYTNRYQYKNAWLVVHIQRMIGSYIAAFNAFVVTNVRFVEPAFLVWILPSFIFIPVLIYWTRKVGQLNPKN